MSIAAPTTIIKGFALAGDKATIPNAPGVTVGAASYTLGFPPATRTPVNMGGVPPFGVDANGVLFDATSNIAWLQGGGHYNWNAAFVAENTGYAVGAILQSTVDPWRYYYNRSPNNANNPDVSIAGWTAFTPVGGQTELQTLVIASGTVNNLAIAAGIGALDLNPTTGTTNLTGIIAEFDGQSLPISNVHASNLVNLISLAGTSSAGNQFRLVADLTIAPGDTLTIQKFNSIGKWIRK